MKKLVSLFAAVMLLISCFSITAMAAAPSSESAQTLDLSNPETILPIDVFRDPDNMEIRKVYELAVNVDPGLIPRDSFERDGYLYECSDILREVVIGDESKTMTEAETVESTKNDMDTILSLLPESKEITTEDGFFGVLLLKASTINCEVSGYGSRSKTVTVTRSYPNLSDADTQYIPKTLEEGGITYTLSDIQWQSDNTYNADDYEITNRYTANVVYSGSKSSSYVKGYIITADYVGEVCRTGVSNIRYTVIYNGTLIPEPEPEPTSTPSSTPESVSESKPTSDYTWAFVVMPILIALAVILTMLHMKRKNRKELTPNAQDYEYDYPDADPDDNPDADIDPGHGG